VIVVRDAVGREIVLAQPARRIVSLVPSLTETLFALGRGDAVAGVTRYCTEPAAALQRVERVGGTKNPSVAQIRALQPDLVLLNAEENRQEDFAALEGAGVNVFVSFPRRVRDVVELLRCLGDLTDARAAAAQRIEELNATLAELAQRRRASRPRVFCPIWKNPWMSFNHDTYDDDMLSVAGGENVCCERAERYCRVTLEEVAAAQPEIILLPDEPYAFAPKDLPALAPLAESPACRTQRVHCIDGKALSWYGARTAAGLRYLRSLL